MLKLHKEYNEILSNVRFIDLFSGIGGFRYALESFGAKCVFSSEWNPAAARAYEINHGNIPYGDITKIDSVDIPKHDILCGGFPCQAFSIAGKKEGFSDTRGTLFFDVLRIASYHKPKMIFLENVPNLEAHDNGRTFQVMQQKIDFIGYDFFCQKLSASDFGVPQDRTRTYIVSFRKDLDINPLEKIIFPAPTGEMCCLRDVLDDVNTSKYIIKDNADYKLEYLSSDFYMLPIEKRQKPIRIGSVIQKDGKGGRQGERIYHPAGHSVTLSSSGGGIGAKTGLYLIDGKVRRLSPRECARLMGLPKNFILGKSDNHNYAQLGNGVVVDVLQAILKQVIDSKIIKSY